MVADHLSRLSFDETIGTTPINDKFPDEQLFSLSSLPWYADIVNYLVTGEVPTNRVVRTKRNFLPK